MVIKYIYAILKDFSLPVNTLEELHNEYKLKKNTDEAELFNFIQIISEQDNKKDLTWEFISLYDGLQTFDEKSNNPDYVYWAKENHNYLIWKLDKVINYENSFKNKELKDLVNYIIDKIEEIRDIISMNTYNSREYNNSMDFGSTKAKEGFIKKFKKEFREFKYSYIKLLENFNHSIKKNQCK